MCIKPCIRPNKTKGTYNYSHFAKTWYRNLLVPEIVLEFLFNVLIHEPCKNNVLNSWLSHSFQILDFINSKQFTDTMFGVTYIQVNEVQKFRNRVMNQAKEFFESSWVGQRIKYWSENSVQTPMDAGDSFGTRTRYKVSRVSHKPLNGGGEGSFPNEGSTWCRRWAATSD